MSNSYTHHQSHLGSLRHIRVERKFTLLVIASEDGDLVDYRLSSAHPNCEYIQALAREALLHGLTVRVESDGRTTGPTTVATMEVHGTPDSRTS